MTDVAGNPEEERRAEFYYQPWAQEAVCRYFYSKVIFPVFCRTASRWLGAPFRVCLGIYVADKRARIHVVLVRYVLAESSSTF